ncbi:MAG: BMP family ABC transporter substrate-binding protein [Chloroflexi bacterium]|nr:BMP family ABC transporter substrate-binding protein [Chloroflexota bacterium]
MKQHTSLRWRDSDHVEPHGLSRRRLLRIGGLLLTGGAASGLLAACSSPAAPPAASPSAVAAATTAPAVASGGKTIKAAFVYTGPVNDHGWSNAHDDGRKALEQALGSSVETAFTENVPETADSQRVFEDYARKGYDIIYGTSFGFMDYMLEAARSFPNVKFDHCSGFKTAPNLATYYAAEEEPRYVSGMIAGKMTKTNTMGFVGSFPIPEVVRFLNAFAAGVQATNPDAKIHMVWINTWFDPPREKSGAESVLDLNADVLTGTTDSPSLAQTAAARGKYAIGVDYDQASYAPNAILQSDRFIWGPHYINSVKAVVAGTWKPVQFYYHTKDGMVEATTPTSLVPADIARPAMDIQAQIKAGTFNIWTGPLVDNHGTVKAPAGKTLGDFYAGPPPEPGQTREDAYAQSNQMSWALSNIIGDIPQS